MDAGYTCHFSPIVYLIRFFAVNFLLNVSLVVASKLFTGVLHKTKTAT